jgi:hypothetical protein
MAIVVRCCAAASNASCTSFSDSESRADVASSRSKILGLRNRARAMAIRCFCPPLRRFPCEPTTVEMPSLEGELACNENTLVGFWGRGRRRRRGQLPLHLRERHNKIVNISFPTGLYNSLLRNARRRAEHHVLPDRTLIYRRLLTDKRYQATVIVNVEL